MTDQTIIIGNYQYIRLRKNEKICYKCGRIFRCYISNFKTKPPQKQILVNIEQDPKEKYFCSKECKERYIYDLQRLGRLD